MDAPCYLRKEESLSNLEAFNKCWSKIKGANSCLMIFKNEPDRIYAAKNTGSLLVGRHENGFAIASQTSAFNEHVTGYLPMPDNEVSFVLEDFL